MGRHHFDPSGELRKRRSLERKKLAPPGFPQKEKSCTPWISPKGKKSHPLDFPKRKKVAPPGFPQKEKSCTPWISPKGKKLHPLDFPRRKKVAPPGIPQKE